MILKQRKKYPVLLSITLFLIICGIAFSQTPKPPKSIPGPEIPGTILPDKIIKYILNEVSGQLAFNNEVMMAGYNHIRTPEEFKGHFYEAEYLYKKLLEYGIDEVKLETYSRDVAGRGGWWVRVDAELWMVSPEEKRLSRLAEHPALMARGCDEGEWEAELIYLDKRDLPSSYREPLKADVKGKIILTPESIGSFSRRAFAKGALGIISYNSHAKPYLDPYQAFFDMRLYKGKIKHKVFGFKIWQHLGDQLKGMLFNRQKVVVRAKTKTASYPMKLDTIFATIKGKSPEKKGFMFTAHLFERPAKQGANDNVSGCVALAEIARTITTLIKEGKIERPERSIYFLMGEEGGSTISFFKEYPEMADKIFGVYNYDMVGENLNENHAFFNMIVPLYSKISFIDSIAKNSMNYVFETNMEKHSAHSRAPWIDYPVPIVEKNGSKQPFRYVVDRFEGGSDHQMFIYSDSGIPACHFIVWPDFWYHTDKDRPDKSDPTQLKRVAFIGAASALAMCSGREDILENLIRNVYRDRLDFIQKAVSRAIKNLSDLREDDRGITYKNSVNHVKESVELAKVTLAKIQELTHGKGKLKSYLGNVIKNVDKFSSFSTQHLKDYYLTIAKHRGFKASFPKTTALEKKMSKIVPVKVEPIELGALRWLSPVARAIGEHSDFDMNKIHHDYSFQYLIELYLSVDGKRTLAQIKSLLDFEYKPLPASEFMKIMNAWEKGKLIKFKRG